MTFDMAHHDDEWLDRVLSTKPQMPDDGFAQRVNAHILAYERRRRIILGLSICGAFLMALWIVPWGSLFDWILTSGSIVGSAVSALEAQDIRQTVHLDLTQARQFLTSAITLASLCILGFAAWVLRQC